MMETQTFLMTSTFYPPYHIGGDAILVRHLSEELAKRGHEVHVMFSPDAYRIKRKDEPEKKKLGNVEIHPLNSPFGKLTPLKAYAFGNSSFILKNFKRLVKDIKPSIVHHHNISLLGHRLLSKIGKYRQLYTAHDYWLICQKNDMMRGRDICSERNCMTCALLSKRPPQFWRKKLYTGDIDCLISPSRYMAHKLKNLGPPVTVIPNFILDPPENIINIEENDYFLYLGVIDEHKGIRILLDSFSKSSQKLILIGRGPMSGYVKRYIEAKNLGQRIKYLDWVEDKWPYLRQANATIIPSIWPENHPLVALESISVGTPVICSDMGGTPEIVKEISEKLVIPSNELESRLRNIELADISRDNIIDIFRSKFSADIYMKRYLEILKGGC